MSVLGLACGCPKGNVVSAMRGVSVTLRLQTTDGVMTGNGTSPPDGEGISFDRSAVVASLSQTSRPLPDDLVLFVMSPGCHPDSS
ncbi:MAG TPA: hypothetical protein VNO55_00180, partial [Polyangia bacterium]|nr:hypothetical protein [Polyangia bacterium]